MHKLMATVILSLSAASGAQAQNLLNVSYDPTREFYRVYNAEFIKYWKEKSGETVSVQQSHGGSGAQARAVQRIDADAAVVRQDGQAGRLHGGACLDAGIADEAVLGFGGFGQTHLGRADHLDAKGREHLPHLLELAGVVGGDQQPPLVQLSHASFLMTPFS